MELSRIYPGYVMTDYRSFRSGVDEFYTTTSQNLSATFSYRQTRTGVFGNAMVMQTWHHNPYTLVQQLYGDYVVYSYSTARSDGTMFIASGSLGKSLDFMRGSVKINGSFNRNGSRLISESREVNSVTRSWAAGIKLNGVPLHFMSFDYSLNLSSSRLDMGRNNASWLSGMKNQLMLNFMPASQWEWHIAGEHYRNELTAGDYKNVFLLDTKLVYKLSKSLELSAALNNICDQRTYNYTIYNQYTSFESQRLLRGREFLLSIALRK